MLANQVTVANLLSTKDLNLMPSKEPSVHATIQVFCKSLLIILQYYTIGGYHAVNFFDNFLLKLSNFKFFIKTVKCAQPLTQQSCVLTLVDSSPGACTERQAYRGISCRNVRKMTDSQTSSPPRKGRFHLDCELLHNLYQGFLHTLRVIHSVFMCHVSVNRRTYIHMHLHIHLSCV